jgi:hypothetical protein
VEQAIDVSGQAAANDLGNYHEDAERDQPSLPDHATHPEPIIRSRFAVPEAFAEVGCADRDRLLQSDSDGGGLDEAVA